MRNQAIWTWTSLLLFRDLKDNIMSIIRSQCRSTSLDFLTCIKSKIDIWNWNTNVTIFFMNWKVGFSKFAGNLQFTRRYSMSIFSKSMNLLSIRSCRWLKSENILEMEWLFRNGFHFWFPLLSFCNWYK